MLAVDAVARHSVGLAVSRMVPSVPNFHVCALVPLQAYVHTLWPGTKLDLGTSMQLPNTRRVLPFGNHVSACAFVVLHWYPLDGKEWLDIKARLAEVHKEKERKYLEAQGYKMVE